MKLIKIILSLILIGGLIFLGIYGISVIQSDRVHNELTETVAEARRATAVPTATPVPTATATPAPTATATPAPTATASPAPTATATPAPMATATPAPTATATPAPTATASPAPTATATPAPTATATPAPTATATPAPTATATPAPTATATPVSTTTTTPAPTATASPVPTATATPSPTAAPEGDPVLAKYAELAAKNPDMIGWVYIEGTRVDYPVMFHPEKKNYYLHRNFNKRYAIDGIPFLDERCDPWAPSDNLIIYGHNMRSGNMFNSLQQYVKEDFFEEHQIVHFDTLKERGVYRVFAVIPVHLTVMDDERMRCYGVLMTQDQRQIDTLEIYVKRYAARYRLEALPGVGGEVITLSTCTGFANADRLVVMATRLTEEELAALEILY